VGTFKASSLVPMKPLVTVTRSEARSRYRCDDGPTDEVLAAELMAARARREPAVPRHRATVPASDPYRMPR